MTSTMVQVQVEEPGKKPRSCGAFLLFAKSGQIDDKLPVPCHLTFMTGKNKPDMTYLAIRFSLEFVVVVLGISFSFWVNEWSKEREAIRQRTTDAAELVDDLIIDGSRIDRVLGAIQQGKINTSRIMRNHRLMRKGFWIMPRLQTASTPLVTPTDPPVFHERRDVQITHQQRPASGIFKRPPAANQRLLRIRIETGGRPQRLVDDIETTPLITTL